jgi:uncharacterized protein
MLRVVIDTNIWVRILMRGSLSLPVLQAFQQDKFQLVISAELFDELQTVLQRPQIQKRIKQQDADDLLEQIEWRGEFVNLTSIPPNCRDPKDDPVLATAIDGRAQAIVSGDSDLRADDALREAMLQYSVQLWGVNRLLDEAARNK